MRFEPMTLRDSMVSNGEMWVFDWKRIMQSHSQMMTWHIHLWTHNCIMESHWGISKMKQSQRVKKNKRDIKEY